MIRLLAYPGYGNINDNSIAHDNLENTAACNPVLLTWIYFNPNMDENCNTYMVWDEINNPSPNVNGTAVI